MVYTNLFSSETSRGTVGEETVPRNEENALRVTIPKTTPARWLRYGGRALLAGGSHDQHVRLAKAVVRRHLNGDHAEALDGGPRVLWATALPGMDSEEARVRTGQELGTLGGNRVTVHSWSEETPASQEELRYVAKAEGANLVILDTAPCLAGTGQSVCDPRKGGLINTFQDTDLVAVLALHNHPAGVNTHHCDLIMNTDLLFKVREPAEGELQVDQVRFVV